MALISSDGTVAVASFNSWSAAIMVVCEHYVLRGE